MADNALSLIQSWINISKKKVQVIPRTDLSDKCEELLGISEHSSLGTLVNHTGGLSVSDGWIRHFGGSNGIGLSIKMVNMITNKLPTLIPGILIVADDVLGGLFGINVNTKIGKVGSILYLPPDSFIWEDLELGHTAFLKWSISGDTALFFKKFEMLTLPDVVPFNKTFFFSPPLWITASSLSGRSSVQIDSQKAHAVRAGIIKQLP